jgi:hypothetical protein
MDDRHVRRGGVQEPETRLTDLFLIDEILKNARTTQPAS